MASTLTQQKVRDLWKWLAITMSCPILLIGGLNVSMLVVFVLWYQLAQKKSLLQFSNASQLLPLFFGLAAITSTINLIGEQESLALALAVLPNYLYWCIMVWIFITVRHEIPYQHIAKYIWIGIVILTLYYVGFRQFSIPGFLTNPSPNSYSLLIIAFASPACYYIYKQYGIMRSMFLLALLLIVLISEGRRAGSVLTFLSCTIAIFFPNLKVQTLVIGLALSMLIGIGLMSETGEDLVLAANPRIHELLYESDKVVLEDRSYLTRQLMIEKSLIIFRENPLLGIGLNNFTNVSVDLVGEFEGSEFVVNKEGMNDKSAHNSYANMLAEGGLFLILPFLGLILYNIIQFVRHYNHRKPEINAFYWSYIAMTIHLYFITGVVNVFVWFFIGLVTAASARSSNESRILLS
ncbi:MAG: O-antigen ligase family protein [Bacteroidia bacterium]|jgi:O-antigen ligase|nr:O-antigen ligase family protein [Bacteroidia bacterium]